MSVGQHFRGLIWPAVATLLALGMYLARGELGGLTGNDDALWAAVTALSYFAFAWLLSRVVAMALDHAVSRKRRYPRLLKDMIAALLFVAALAAGVASFLGQGAVGALAGAGLILSMLGFAIRNVVADTLSGIALGVEGPFRIGDWVEIEGLARGRVVEIGWRTTRLLTPDATHMILPNSQVARQRITNYSAPRSLYRTQISITLDHELPIRTARTMMLEAVGRSENIERTPPPDVRVLSYDEAGITYAVRYWLTRFDREVDCRDDVFSNIDDIMRDAGVTAPRRRMELVSSSRRASPVPA